MSSLRFDMSYPSGYIRIKSKFQNILPLYETPVAILYGGRQSGGRRLIHVIMMPVVE